MDDVTVKLIAPGHVPDEVGGSYSDACQALELEQSTSGWVLYLLDVMHTRGTCISTHTAPVAEALDSRGTERTNGELVCALATVAREVRSGHVVEVRPGWPEEFGGGPRCQFCLDPAPSWVYEAADVEVLLGDPAGDITMAPVLGAEITGCVDWPACQGCRELIDARTGDAWHRLLRRYGGRDGVPMPVQAAWREFWGNHRGARPLPPPAWTPARRRLEAHRVRLGWDAVTDAFRREEVEYTSEPGVPALAGLDAAFEAARAYLLDPPPAGRVRRYRAEGTVGWIVRADGDGWSLVGHTGDVAFVVRDDTPDVLIPVRGPETSALLDGLAHLADPHSAD
ncbi:hypothetical protein [Actinomadura harenae]|uniref:Uncharacterized protein n=1 Tax=Actinomadura harenae TaxID=2483351 RepID=A0A3M2LYB5_9ACTN|nr:hypothetical protein [Actinomadura harenae]RMI39968.1 hypothetical protein EBO15_28145 [Actinomadura harenae]